MLVDVMQLIRRGQHFALIDEVDSEILKNLCFREMPDACLGHHRDGNRTDNLLDQAGLGHARHPALGTDHGRHPFQGHDGGGSSSLGNHCLLRAHDVHDDAALEHLGQAQLQPQSGWVIAIHLSHRVCLHGTCPSRPRSPQV